MRWHLVVRLFTRNQDSDERAHQVHSWGRNNTLPVGSLEDARNLANALNSRDNERKNGFTRRRAEVCVMVHFPNSGMLYIPIEFLKMSAQELHQCARWVERGGVDEPTPNMDMDFFGDDEGDASERRAGT